MIIELYKNSKRPILIAIEEIAEVIGSRVTKKNGEVIHVMETYDTIAEMMEKATSGERKMVRSLTHYSSPLGKMFLKWWVDYISGDLFSSQMMHSILYDDMRDRFKLKESDYSRKRFTLDIKNACNQYGYDFRSKKDAALGGRVKIWVVKKT